MDSKVYAIDFDGTLCTNRFPALGEPIAHVIEWVKWLKREGHYVILWTCREGQSLQEAIDFCARYGLTFDAHNENLPHRIEQYKTDPRKIGADLYIDDLAITAPYGIPLAPVFTPVVLRYTSGSRSGEPLPRCGKCGTLIEAENWQCCPVCKTVIDY